MFSVGISPPEKYKKRDLIVFSKIKKQPNEDNNKQTLFRVGIPPSEKYK